MAGGAGADPELSLPEEDAIAPMRPEVVDESGDRHQPPKITIAAQRVRLQIRLGSLRPGRPIQPLAGIAALAIVETVFVLLR
jgi:hypothetical protein